MTAKYQLRAAVLKAMAHPVRLQILDYLRAHEEVCVCQMVAVLDESQPMISKHFAALRDAGLLARRKDGLKVFYTLKVPCLHEFFHCLDTILWSDVQERAASLGGSVHE